jgi:hypothetical protein
MVTCLYALFYIYLITFTSTSCSHDFDIDEITKFSCENIVFDFDEEVASFANDFHYSVDFQVQTALQCSPIWFTETNDTKNESEAVLEGETYEAEADNFPEVIDDLSTRPLEIIKRRRISGSLRNDCGKDNIRKEIQERYRKKSRIPSEYDEINIDWASTSSPEYFENPDIVDNIHFKPCTKGHSLLKKRKTNAVIDDDNPEVDDSEYVLEEEEEKYEFNNSPEVIDNLSACHRLHNRRKYFRKNMLERFQKETGQLEAKYIIWKLLDKSRLPSQYHGIEIDSDSMSRAEYFENLDIVDNIHFKQYTENQPALKECKTNVCIDVDNSEIDDAENKSAYAIEQEKHEINYSPEVIDHHTVRPPIRYNPVHDRRIKFRINLLDRFQKETGHIEAKNINWKLLDRSRIPSEYDGIKIDSILMMKTEYFENPEIVDNIHFKPCTEDRLDSEADASNIVPVDIKRRLLEIFCTDLGCPNASSIIWDRIDSDRLPEKYKNILLTSRTVYGQKLYENPEFMENVHFKPYNKKKSKN